MYDLDLGGSNLVSVQNTHAYLGDYTCQVFSNSFNPRQCYGPDRIIFDLKV